jgi:hypothetical protein
MTAALKLAAGEEEEEADSIDFVELYQEFEALERRVKVQGMHIQQIRLEAEREYQPKERLEEAGGTPAQEELAGVKLSEEGVEQQFSKGIAELKSATEWQVKATTDGKNIAWEIMMIYPFAEKKCSRGDCIHRASHGSSWTRR